jgi:cell division protein FtsZ
MIRDAAGDEAEIIFGTVQDPNVENEVRVTVIATGFEPTSHAEAMPVIRPSFAARKLGKKGVPALDRDLVPVEVSDPSDLEIPTFIRRQMD